MGNGVLWFVSVRGRLAHKSGLAGLRVVMWAKVRFGPEGYGKGLSQPQIRLGGIRSGMVFYGSVRACFRHYKRYGLALVRCGQQRFSQDWLAKKGYQLR